MDLASPKGIYRTNTLARLNVADRMSTPLAQAEFEEFRRSFGRPAQLTLLYHWARLIELLYHAEHVIELLNDPEITGKETRVPATPRAALGIGCVEAPRGTLIHEYRTDDAGMLTDVNLIVGTTHNNAPINMSVRHAATSLIRDGKVDVVFNSVPVESSRRIRSAPPARSDAVAPPADCAGGRSAAGPGLAPPPSVPALCKAM